MTRRRLWLFILSVLLLITVCTAVSFKNYTAGLNRVSVSSTAPNQIRTKADSSGVFLFSDIQKLSLPADCRVEEVLVSVGENFKEGQPLIKLNRDDVAILYYQMLLQQRTLEEQANQTDEIRREIAAHSLSRLEEQTAFLSQLQQNEGVVYAEFPGQITELNVIPGDITTARSSLSYGNLEGEGHFEWYIDAKQYRAFTGTTAGGDGFSLELKISSRLYLEDKKLYRYTSKPVLLESIPEPVHGMYTAIQMEYFSEDYAAVLPKNCIETDSDGGNYVYLLRERDGVLGKESYLQRVGVTVLETDNINAAVMKPLENLVVHSARPPQDLEKVLVIDTEA